MIFALHFLYLYSIIVFEKLCCGILSTKRQILEYIYKRMEGKNN